MKIKNIRRVSKFKEEGHKERLTCPYSLVFILYYLIKIHVQPYNDLAMTWTGGLIGVFWFRQLQKEPIEVALGHLHFLAFLGVNSFILSL